jgi:N-succinyldiaminopimelate aminotransferase
MTRLAQKHDAVNLGQGFPDFDGPEFVKEAAIAAIRAGKNQYCPTHGVPALRDAISEHHRHFYDQSFDPETEVTVYAGATEAIFATLQGLLNAGDEVVLFEPFYDSYRASVAMAGATSRVVTLHAPDFRFDPDELTRAVTKKTRAILVNTPHNPTGRVFTRTELEQIAALCRQHDLIAISDEVYEHILFEGEHIPIATLPGMRERTVQISSTGKTFSLTGWKVGYSCAPPEITNALRSAHQFVTFCNGTPLQHAMAEAVRAPDSYYRTLAEDYRKKRDRLCEGLREVGFGVHLPAGTYFVLADIRPLGFDDDVAFCRMLPETTGVVAIPPTSFYVHKDAGRHLVRFAFCKTAPVLEEAVRRLHSLKN